MAALNEPPVSEQGNLRKSASARISSSLSNLVVVIARLPSRIVRWFWKHLSPHLPGTHQFDRRQQRIMVEIARKKRTRFNNLQSLSSETRQQIYRQTRHRLNEAAIMEGWQKPPESLWPISGCGLMIIVFIIFPQLIRERLEVPTVSFLGASILGWIGLMIAFSPSFPFYLIIRRNDRIRYSHPAYGVLLVLVYGIIILYLLLIPSVIAAPLPDIVKFTLVVGMAYYPAFVGLFVVVFVLIAAIRQYLRWWWHNNLPEAMLVDQLLLLLEMAEDPQANWNDLGFRRRLIRSISKCIPLMQTAMPRQLSLDDETTQIWAKKQFEDMSNALRDLKKWVVLPMQDTRGRFSKRIAEILVPMVRGDWHNIPQIEYVEALPFRATFSYRLLGLMKLMLKAAPGILWLAFQQSPYALTGPLADSLTVFAFSLIIAVVAEAFGLNIDTLKALGNFK